MTWEVLTGKRLTSDVEAVARELLRLSPSKFVKAFRVKVLEDDWVAGFYRGYYVELLRGSIRVADTDALTNNFIAVKTRKASVFRRALLKEARA